MGEDNGLEIKLSNSEKIINILLGNVQAIRFLDEGLVQNLLYDNVYIGDKEVISFENIMYEIIDGEFYNFVDKISYGMAKELKMKHYIIITQNYNIEILTQWEPDITSSSSL